MEKTNANNTALAIFFIATAVMLIGGLAVIPLTTTAMTAKPNFAARPNFVYCTLLAPASFICALTEEGCEEFIDSDIEVKGQCHRMPLGPGPFPE